LQLPVRRADSLGAYWLFPVFPERREDFARAMKARGVPVSVVDRRIDAHPVLGGVRDNLPGAARFDERQIHLPIHEGLTDEDVERVIGAVKGGW
jgi:perosamine synthetase